LNAEFESELTRGPLRVGARDVAGDARAVELDGHPFFVATLFQPERAALEQRVPPIVLAFVRAAAVHAARVAAPADVSERQPNAPTPHPPSRSR
jgi:CTP synthase (UTP-ammonia lyase)